MNERQPSPGFDLPPRRPETAEGASSATPARLVAWLDSVPTDDPTAAIKRLLEVARIMNRATVGYAELLELTDRLDARAGPVLGRIESQLREPHPPQEGEDQPLAKAHAELLQELALSHLRLVEEGSDQERLPIPDIGRHLRRALVLIGCMCLQHWRLHELEPEGTWRRIHRIVAVAQELGVISDPGAEDAGHLSFAPDSIERVAARIGVLAAGHVWSLHADEIETLAQWVQSVPVQCSEPPAAAGTLPETSARLWMSLDGDAPPSLIVGTPPAEDASARLIELQPVMAALRATPPQVPSAAQEGAEPLDRRLRKRWAVPLVTQFNDGPAHAGPFVAVTGLLESHALIHSDIHGKRSPSAVMSDLMPGGFFAASVDDPLGIPDVFKAGLGYREARGTMDIGGKAPPVMQEVQWLSPRRLQHMVETWESTLRGDDDQPLAGVASAATQSAMLTCAWLRNVGAGNVSLLLQAPTQGLASGSLLALRIADQEKILWKLGVIRWLRFGSDGHVSLGAEYLAEACWPTQLHLIDYETPVDVVRPGFFFRDRGRPEVGVLLFAPHAFPPGARVAFDLFGKEYIVTLKATRPVSHALSWGEFPNPLRSR
jgi:hypothetical protein